MILELSRHFHDGVGINSLHIIIFLNKNIYTSGAEKRKA